MVEASPDLGWVHTGEVHLGGIEGLEVEGIVGVPLDCMDDFDREGSVIGCYRSIEGKRWRMCLLGMGRVVVVVAGEGRKAGRHLVEVLARRANVVVRPF